MKRLLVIWLSLFLFISCAVNVPDNPVGNMANRFKSGRSDSKVNTVRTEKPVKQQTDGFPAFQAIYNKYGVRVITNTRGMIPDEWVRSPINGKARAANPRYFEKAALYMDEGLSRYPSAFLMEQLKGISICSSLSFYNVPFGGTACYGLRTVIIILNADTSRGWFVGTVHHELNHLLVQNNGFPMARWKGMNKSGFKYGKGSVEALRSGKDGSDRSEKFFKDGFVCEYAKSDEMEDVATMAEYALTDWKDFKKRALKHPIIARKFALLQSFYKNLDGRLDSGFWER